MTNPALLVCFTFMSLLSCTGQTTKNTVKNSEMKSAKNNVMVTGSPAQNTALGNKISFKEGENKFLKEAEMNVTFTRMLEDSRCPVDAKCVWEGAATAELTVMGTYTRPMKFKISTLSNEARGYTSSVLFNGYKISLVQASPSPTTASGFKNNSGKYQITLQVENEADAETASTKR